MRKPGSVGKPMMFSEAKIVDLEDNDIQVASERGWRTLPARATRLPGLWNNPIATAQVLDAEGWFHTGDLARCDEDGFFYIAAAPKT